MEIMLNILKFNTLNFFRKKIELIKLDLNQRETIKIELDVNNNLKNIRKNINKFVPFPFIFLDEDENEVPKNLEESKYLNTILDGKILHIKKEKKNRIILGGKINSKEKLDYYLYPEVELNKEQKKIASNILIIGETGVGKSTWIHSILNYLQEVEIDEDIRYLLFDEQKQQKEYEEIYGKKPDGSSVTDEPEIFNIGPSRLYNNPIRLIDTAGFGDTRGELYDDKIVRDLYKFLDSSNIDYLRAICLILKATETRAHERVKDIFDKILSLFSKEIKPNIIIIFTFADSFEEFPALKMLKDESSPFSKVLGNIDSLPYFSFNNWAYFTNTPNNSEFFYKTYENNNNSFLKFFEYISKLKNVSLENTKKVIKYRIKIIDSISQLCKNLKNTNSQINSIFKSEKELIKKKKEYFILNTGNSVLLCKNHNKICSQNYQNENSYPYYKKFYSIRCKLCGCLSSEHRIIMSMEDNSGIKESTKNEIKRGNEQLIQAKSRLYYGLMSGLEALYKIILKNNKLNEISLKKDLDYEFIEKNLKRNIKGNNEVNNFFLNALYKIDTICENEVSKENAINILLKRLLNNENNSIYEYI